MARNKRTKAPKIVLVVGERDEFTEPLSRKFSSAGYRPVVEKTGAAALVVARTMRPAAFVVDGKPSSVAARELCSHFKARVASAATVIANSRQGSPNEKIDAVAPSGLSAAEIVDLTGRTLQKVSSSGVTIAGAFRVDCRSRQIFFHGKEMQLTSTEYDLLSFLIRNSGCAVSRSVILRDVWGYPPNSATRTLDMLVCRLRGKMGDEALRLETVYRMGYRLRTEPCL